MLGHIAQGIPFQPKDTLHVSLTPPVDHEAIRLTWVAQQVSLLLQHLVERTFGDMHPAPMLNRPEANAKAVAGNR